jgi:type IV secretory pathway VirB10-like protein
LGVFNKAPQKENGMVKVESSVTRDVGLKRSTLSILAVFVLLISSFTFSSCKGCKDENKGKDGDGAKAGSDTATESRTDEGDTSSQDPKPPTKTDPKPPTSPKLSADEMKKIAGDNMGAIKAAHDAAWDLYKEHLCNDNDEENFIDGALNTYGFRKGFAIEMEKNGAKTERSDEEKAEALAAEQKMKFNEKGRLSLYARDDSAKEYVEPLQKAMPDADDAWKKLLEAEAKL